MGWLRLLKVVPWKIVTPAVLALMVYFCWQQQQRAKGEAKAWHQVVETINADVARREAERMKNRVANEAMVKQLEDSIAHSQEKKHDLAFRQKTAKLRETADSTQRVLVDSLEYEHQMVVGEMAQNIVRLNTIVATRTQERDDAERLLADSQHYNATLQKALLAEQKSHSSKLGYVVGAVGVIAATVAIVTK